MEYNEIDVFDVHNFIAQIESYPYLPFSNFAFNQNGSCCGNVSKVSKLLLYFRHGNDFVYVTF